MVDEEPETRLLVDELLVSKDADLVVVARFDQLGGAKLKQLSLILVKDHLHEVVERSQSQDDVRYVELLVYSLLCLLVAHNSSCKFERHGAKLPDRASR